jgi:hypothetical protein
MSDEQKAAPSPADDTDELARLLLRSARLDVPAGSAQSRALSRGLGELHPSRRTSLRVMLGGAGLALAAAAALALLLLRPTPVGSGHVMAERIRGTATLPAPAPAPVLAPRAACPELVIARGDALLIEDFEQDDSWLLKADGRKGSWITYDDGTGTQATPSRSALFPSRIPGGRATSKRGLHVKGGKFTGWGVTFGTELADAACYDASRYAGIELWAKGPGQIRVGLQMIDVQDVKYGGFCQTDCYCSHRQVIELGSSFKKYVLRWEDLKQLFDAGPRVDFDPRRVRFLEFGIEPGSTPFDIWIDDVAFIPR